MNHLENAVFKHLAKQSTQTGIEEGYYTVDLIQDIINDPRIADAELKLTTYKTIIGNTEWKDLLHKHAHANQEVSA